MHRRPPSDVLDRITDTPVPNLTVEAQLLYAADLSAPRRVPAAAKAACVNDVIRLLGLEAVRNRQIGCAWTPRIPGWSLVHISTMVVQMAVVHRGTQLTQHGPSQYQRVALAGAAEDVRLVSIGVALVSQPGALAVDDPTCGLSHSAGNRIMRSLKVRRLTRPITVCLCSGVCVCQWHPGRVE